MPIGSVRNNGNYGEFILLLGSPIPLVLQYRCKFNYIKPMRNFLFLMLLGLSSGCSQEAKPAVKNTSQAQAVRDTIWIDVRTPGEFEDGHLIEATNIPLQVFAEQFPIQVPKTDKVIALYCRSGNRSGQALKIALEMGYTNAFNAGGFQALKGSRK